MKYGIAGEYTSIIEVKNNEKNPFLLSINHNDRIVLRMVKNGDTYLTPKMNDIQKSNELKIENKELRKIDLGIGKIKHKQTSPFVLLYTDKIIPYNKICGNTAITILYILSEKVGLNSDIIIMNPNELVEKLKMSTKTSYKVFLELINNNIIAKRDDNVWWINPNYFYSGNRLDIRTK